MRNKITKIVAATAVAMSAVACSSIDCPLNNRTYMSLKLTGNEAVLEDTLTIAAERTPDNKTASISRFSPESHLKILANIYSAATSE